MSYLIDFGLIAIFGYSIWRGYRRGAIMGLCAVFAIIISIIAANVFANVYSSEFTGLLEPFVGGITDTTITTVRSSESDGLVVVLSEDEKQDVTMVSYATIRQIGICDTVAHEIATEVGAKNNDFGNEMADDITNQICERTLYAITFFVGFVVVIVVFVVIGNVLNLKLSVPEYEKINKYVGAGIGVIIGIVVLLLITLIFRYIGILVSNELIGKTVFFEWLINDNKLANIIGV